MAWLRIDDGFDEHPKILALTDREKIRHLSSMCWSARNRTNGHIPPYAWDKLGLTEALVQKFVNVALWDICADGGHVIHDWGEYNPSLPDPTGADRQARYRERKRNATVTPLRNGTDDAAATATKAAPVTETSNGSRARGHAPVPHPHPQEPPIVLQTEPVASPPSPAPQGRSLGEALEPAYDAEKLAIPAFLARSDAHPKPERKSAAPVPAPMMEEAATVAPTAHAIADMMKACGVSAEEVLSARSPGMPGGR